ncbi:hypothetical protein ABIB25_005245 [Nakamurella sp. UYEF19]|uniref:hypothetical protein n=1 Tax=Nakamurella sp. UYEF19 TaxID=1756392 RepID=UPI00339B4DAE
MTDDITATVPSFLGLIVTIFLGDDAVTLSTLDSPTAETSLLVTVATPRGGPACEVVLYAGHRGAFLELAADSRAVFGDAGQVIVDGHLPPPTNRLYPTNSLRIAELSQINQALGVLIAEGHLLSAARTVLQHRADDRGVTLAAAARQTLTRLG